MFCLFFFFHSPYRCFCAMDLKVVIVCKLLNLRNPNEIKTFKRNDFKTLFLEIIALATDYYAQNSEEVMVMNGWTHLFNNYCLQTGSSISYQCMKDLHSSVQYAFGLWAKKKNFQEIICSLLSFTKNHLIDGGNTLIGLQPEEEFFKKHFGLNADGGYKLLGERALLIDTIKKSKKKESREF